MKIPFLDLAQLHATIAESLQTAYQRVLQAGCFILGPELEAFEHEFANYCCVDHCIGVGSGLEALHLLLRAYRIGPGDEVIVPANTFIATWLAVSECGAIPIPVEPNILTHNIDVHLMERAITAQTRAVIPTHLYGQTADMDPINQLAEQYGLVVIEDAAQAQGARYKDRPAGSLGHAAATSFYPGKNLGALGDGGAVLTNDLEIAQKIRRLRNYGSQVKYCHELMGYNSRLDELQAAFLRVKLRLLDQWNTQRTAAAAQYTHLLRNTDLICPTATDDMAPVWHVYVIRSPRRDHLRDYLHQNSVATVIHYPIPPHRQPCYQHTHQQYSLPTTDQLANEVLSLPLSPLTNRDQIGHVVKLIKQFESFK